MVIESATLLTLRLGSYRFRPFPDCALTDSTGDFEPHSYVSSSTGSLALLTDSQSLRIPDVTIIHRSRRTIMAKRQTRVLSARCAFFAYCYCCTMPVIGHAQSTFGDIRGTTRDPSGLALPQALVTLHNVDENTTRSALSDDNANFLFENLKPGNYTAGRPPRKGSPRLRPPRWNW